MIKIPYTVTADISKYDGEVFNRISNSHYLTQKQIELDKFGSGLGYTLLSGFSLVEDLSLYCGFKKTNDIREIALQLEEDVAILYNGRLVSMCFCFPSGFRPMDKMGMTFMEMHTPVPDKQKLDRASDKVVEMISKPGAVFRRYVWTLTTSPQLSRHPYYKSFEPTVTTIHNLYFRNEIQTTVGYNDGKTSFFFVKVDIISFISLPSETQQEAIDSINTMSDAVLEYKGLNEIKKLF
jgi:hypothetical protein